MIENHVVTTLHQCLKELLTDKWGFGYLIGWFVGGTSCTLQTLYAWLMRGFGIGWNPYL